MIMSDNDFCARHILRVLSSILYAVSKIQLTSILEKNTQTALTYKIRQNYPRELAE